jgi:nitroimidazol reductase NimA-like FMN-containing flavoprotein (pyridoxamine 5'-phosphate oxidase superfamily)
MTFERTPRTTPRRRQDRVSYEVARVHAVLDEALFGHLGFIVDGRPRVLPTLCARIGSQLYLHGSTGAGMMLSARGRMPVCLTVTLLDGIVMARSWFNHSINSRSVVVHGDAELVLNDDEKWEAMIAIMNHVSAGRADESREANPREFAATAILRLPLEEVSLKVRTGGPLDDNEDLALPHWAGVVRVTTTYGPADGVSSVEPPPSISAYRRPFLR